MLLSEHKDLKLEIKSLPEKEKDKLLLRLIAKDKVLTEHLHFKLMENEGDLEERQKRLRMQIDEGIKELSVIKKPNSKDALLKMRKLNGSINHHLKVTKDVNTELELRIHLLRKMPIDFNESVFSALHKFNEKLMVYFAKSSATVFAKYQKLHEDLQFDLKPLMAEVLDKVHHHKTGAMAKELKLPESL